MKNMMILKKTAVLAAAIAGMAMASCEQQPGKYEMSDGVPEVRYVRPVNVDASDSLMTGAYMDNQICIVGENLRSIYELWFNDRKAILNTSFITDNTLIVTVPGELPGKVTNMMYMVTASRDTVKYEFNVLVPAPVLNSMSCEYTPAGESATIYGDYLLDDENQPLEIVFSGDVPVTEITEITKTAVTFVIPEGAEEGGISVTTVNGTSSSAFHYLDSRGFLFDFLDPVAHADSVADQVEHIDVVVVVAEGSQFVLAKARVGDQGLDSFVLVEGLPRELDRDIGETIEDRMGNGIEDMVETVGHEDLRGQDRLALIFFHRPGAGLVEDAIEVVDVRIAVSMADVGFLESHEEVGKPMFPSAAYDFFDRFLREVFGI